MFPWRWQLTAIVALSVLYGTESAVAQTGGYADRELNRIRNRDVGTYTVDRTIQAVVARDQIRGVSGVTQSSLPRRSYSDLGISSGSLGKPFSTVTPSPTVSPYLNLFREDLSDAGDLNYQTLVRPQLDQQRINAQVQRQNTELSRRVQSISARSDYGNPRGSESQYPTGHPTTFGYYSHFYPSAGRR